jgi:alkylated DNA repair dioxygenase AlkB
MDQVTIAGDIPEDDLEYLEGYVGAPLLETLDLLLPSLFGHFQVEQIHKEDGWSPTPRLVASFSERSISFPGARASLPLPAPMRDLCEHVSVRAGHQFNYVLANWYRDGGDNTGWHSDKVEFHDPDSKIAIVSLGATRPFEVRDIATKRLRARLLLPAGSLALMSVHLQTYTEHAIPVVDDPVGPRISLTLRSVITD